MIGHFIQFLGKLTFTGWLFLAMPLILAGAAFLVKKLIRHSVIRWVCYFSLALAITRIVLFFNPVAWATYNKMLPLKYIDWRHSDVLTSETGKYLKPKKNLKYLAVGSSQTSVIYKQYAVRHDEFSIFALAGLSPLDLYTYRKEIIRQNPENVLLYLSEFDLARKPELASSKWSPFSLRDIVELKSLIDTTDYFTEDDQQILYDVFFGKYFPEYKYSFVFKDLTDIILQKNKLLNITPPTQVEGSLSLNFQLQSLKELSDQYISFNLFYLKKSIQELNKKGIRVIIVEGQYNPLAYEPSNLALNRKVKSLLKAYVDEHPDNIFLTRDVIPNFSLEDYDDGYHVKAESGLHFSEILIEHLNSKNYN
jgi:hypothetical protein